MIVDIPQAIVDKFGLEKDDKIYWIIDHHDDDPKKPFIRLEVSKKNINKAIKNKPDGGSYLESL